MFAAQFLWCYFGEFGIGSTNNPLIGIFLNYHHLSAWFFNGTLWRNSVLVTQGVKGLNWTQDYQCEILPCVCFGSQLNIVRSLMLLFIFNVKDGEASRVAC